MTFGPEYAKLKILDGTEFKIEKKVKLMPGSIVDGMHIPTRKISLRNIYPMKCGSI